MSHNDSTHEGVIGRVEVPAIMDVPPFRGLDEMVTLDLHADGCVSWWKS